MVTGCASWLAKLLHGHGRCAIFLFCVFFVTFAFFTEGPIQVTYKGSLDRRFPGLSFAAFSSAWFSYDEVHDSIPSDFGVT